MASQSIYAPKVVEEPKEEEKVESDDEVAPSNPYLTSPLLYVSGIDQSISDRELANSVFQPFVPVRLTIDRTGTIGEEVAGTVEFQTLEKAEKALATVQKPRLSINKDISSDPKPNARPRLIKQLPFATEDVDVFDIFRPYGPLSSTRRIMTNPQGQQSGFRGMALVVFYHEEDAKRAQTDLHCAEVEGKTISVSIDTVSRRPSGQTVGFSAAAAPFVPSAMTTTQPMNAAAPVFQPPRRTSSETPTSPLFSSTSHPHQGGSTVSVPGTNLHYSTSGAVYIDPCNLFCKNLDPSIDSNFLFNLFKDYGRIVSARVMRDEKGASREFGFVSFRLPEDADRALRAMNQTTHGSKQMMVRLHEPKTVRQEKVSSKFGTSYAGPSELPNEGGPSSEANGSSGGSRSPPLDRSRERKTRNSYFRAAASGENGIGLVDIDQLKTMSSSVRVDIVKGEFSRRVKAIESVQDDQVDSLVVELNKMNLPDAVNTLNDPHLLAQRVKEIQTHGHLSSSSYLPEGASMTSSLSMGSEREKLLYAITDLLPADSPVDDITDLVLGLPKKERAMALFNQDYLRKKIEEAQAILELESDDNEEQVTPTPLTKENIALATSSHVNKSDTPTEATKAYTLSDLARMPAVEIVKLASSSQASILPLPKADSKVTKETDTFIDSLQDLPPTDQKQKVGDQLFKKIKTFGVKGAPKITISLLDSEDLRSLAHLMNSYPECLREKVLLHTNKQ